MKVSVLIAPWSEELAEADESVVVGVDIVAFAKTVVVVSAVTASR